MIPLELIHINLLFTLLSMSCLLIVELLKLKFKPVSLFIDVRRTEIIAVGLALLSIITSALLVCLRFFAV